LRRCPSYDGAEGRRRRWTLDFGTTLCVLKADAPRVNSLVMVWLLPRCSRRGNGSGFTIPLEDQVG
jgi:hypothetical protein